MIISRTLENQRKISRTVKSFFNNFSKETRQLVEIRRNFELFEIDVKKKITNKRLSHSTTFILLEFFNILELSLHYILSARLNQFLLLLQMSCFSQSLTQLSTKMSSFLTNSLSFSL